MAIILPDGLTTEEIRVMQEFRRKNTDVLPLAILVAIKHPAGGGEGPVVSLAAKGLLDPDASKENFTLTQKAKDFLSIDARPLVEETSDTAASALAAGPDEDGV